MAASRSLSLAAYRALSRRTAPRALPNWPARPVGELAWIHLGSGDDIRALLDLAERLNDVRGDLTVLLTQDPDDIVPWPATSLAPQIMVTNAPEEHPDAVSAFLHHWHPDVGLWVWGRLRPNLVDLAADRGIPLHLVSADKAGFDGLRDRWLPELSRHLGRCFETATTRSAGAAQRLARLGVPPERITVMPPLRPSGHILEYEISDLDDIMAQLEGRPAWLAADVFPGEDTIAIEAHRLAMRTAHRLLLVLNPVAEGDRQSIIDQLDSYGMSYAIWSEGQYPQETTQVLIADLPDELGLWYRVATVSFLGASLVTGQGGRDPMVAASLGTAILYGPNVRNFLASYTQLVRAGAARIINDTNSLGSAVAQLIAPEQAAAMAHAGWDVATQGAETVDGVIDLVQDSLDARLNGARGAERS